MAGKTLKKLYKNWLRVRTVFNANQERTEQSPPRVFRLITGRICKKQLVVAA
jgi:hypothetical protein